eukprot:902196-Amorphochlora_amoeboformis.AAC.1
MRKVSESEGGEGDGRGFSWEKGWELRRRPLFVWSIDLDNSKPEFECPNPPSSPPGAPGCSPRPPCPPRPPRPASPASPPAPTEADLDGDLFDLKACEGGVGGGDGLGLAGRGRTFLGDGDGPSPGPGPGPGPGPECLMRAKVSEYARRAFKDVESTDFVINLGVDSGAEPVGFEGSGEEPDVLRNPALASALASVLPPVDGAVDGDFGTGLIDLADVLVLVLAWGEFEALFSRLGEVMDGFLAGLGRLGSGLRSTLEVSNLIRRGVSGEWDRDGSGEGFSCWLEGSGGDSSGVLRVDSTTEPDAITDGAEGADDPNRCVGEGGGEAFRTSVLPGAGDLMSEGDFRAFSGFCCD